MTDAINTDPATAPSQRYGQLYPWYDSLWLHDYTVARRILRKVRPDVLAQFEQAMQVFRTRPDFEVKLFDRVFDDTTLAQVRQVIRNFGPADFELHEARTFKRFVVHDHPYFTELQQKLVDLVSDAAGEPIEPSYNFLSLYSASGVCPVHMDSPESKWTLDICLNQTEPWPIWFSQIQPWPSADDDVARATPPLWQQADWQNTIRGRADLGFKSFSMQPGEALLFSGSSQWHGRDAMPSRTSRSSCDLLFMHFVPCGTRELVRAENWARLFSVPELVGLGRRSLSDPGGYTISGSDHQA